MYAATRLFSRRNFFAVVLLLIVMAAAYGFAALNDVAASAAGDGSRQISGYRVTQIHYQLTSADTDPTDVDTVTFYLDDDAVAGNGTAGAPATVQIALRPDLTGTPTWAVCNAVTTYPGTVTCPLPNGVTVVNANYLQVVAAE